MEQELWDSDIDNERLQELLAEDFFEFGRSGRVWYRKDTITTVRQKKDIIFPLPEFHIRLLDENITQVTYDSAFTYDDGVVEHTHRSSIWSRTTNGWELRFHQGTPFSLPLENGE
ncbi:hypothetical protein NIES4101_65130 [Calothrix sp. NIES-4101]|nr:hypothetical protein NIES4101_65130 [Calothrix sp. NIES-4101]